MASRFTCKDEFDCSEDTFWYECMFNEEFLNRLHLDVLKFPAFKVLEHKDQGDFITRRVKLDPPMVGVPGPVLKIVGDKFSYVEEGRFDKKAKKYHLDIKPSAGGDKAMTAGDLWTEKLGDNKCVRHVRIDVDVKIFVVGALLEEKIVSDLKRSYDATAAFVNKFLAEKNQK